VLNYQSYELCRDSGSGGLKVLLRAAHETLGARFGVFFGVELPAGYATLETEWQRARECLALFDTNIRAFFELAGPDRARYLNAVTSGDIRGLTPGNGTPGLLLNAQGHILAEVETYALEDRFLLISHASVRQHTFETLEQFIIMDDCTLTDVSEQFASCALEGPHAFAVLADLCGVSLNALPEFAHQETQIAGAACRILRRSHTGLLGAEILAPREHMLAVWNALLDAARAAGGGPIGWDTVNALRIDAGVRWFGYDFDDSSIPQDAGLEHTHISFTKGCYTWQEIVERVRSRGRLNRWLCLLEFSGAAPPEAGAKLLADGKEWGQVTSCAFSPARKGYIGFGTLRREHNSPGSVLQWSGGTARVLESPAPAPAGRATKPAGCA
jgi:folate-binding protein YgfZ